MNLQKQAEGLQEASCCFFSQEGSSSFQEACGCTVGAFQEALAFPWPEEEEEEEEEAYALWLHHCLCRPEVTDMEGEAWCGQEG